MAQARNDSYLLLDDVKGLGPSNALLRILQKGKTTVIVKKGELVTSCREPVTVTKDQHTHNYCLARDPSITLYCMEQEIVAVDDHEFKLLRAIPSRRDCYRMYSKGLLKWGAKLKANDKVIVRLPSKMRPDTLKKFAGVIRNVGALGQLPGFLFEVQIKEQDYCELECGYRYFFCDEKHTVFVSLDKLYIPNTTTQEKSNGDVEPKTVSVENTVATHDQSHQLEENSTHHSQPQQLQEDANLYAYLEVQSRVQVPSSEPGVEYQYGVIRWIGPFRNGKELFAGIELDEKTIGCTDGTHKESRRKYFKCPPGRGIYYPLGVVMPDARFVDHEAHLIKNPLEDIQEEVKENQALSKDQIHSYIGDRRGIQGHHNSCFLDATLFGLFAVSYEFDEPFLEEFDDHVRKKISHLLWKGIVNPLRKNRVVKFDSVMKLRDELEQVGRLRGITQEEKDPEEFLNLLFKYILQVPPFISIRRPFGVEEEYFVQLFLEPDASLVLPSVGHLLETMFQEQSISFTEVPTKLLIQVPRFGKRFKTFQAIIAEPQLNVASLVDDRNTHKCTVCEQPAKKICNKCSHDENQNSSPYFCNSFVCWTKVHKAADGDHTLQPCDESVCRQEIYEMELLSVICIETSHYVCFTRSEDRWVFFDSMANRVHDKFNIPKVVDCSRELKEWVFPADGDRSKLQNTPPRDLPEYVRRFIQDVYLCVYVRTMCIL